MYRGQKILAFFLSFFIFTNKACAQIGLDTSKQPGGLMIHGIGTRHFLTKNLIQNTITLFFTIGSIGFCTYVRLGSCRLDSFGRR